MTTMDSDRPDSASPSLAGPAHYDPNRLRWVPWAFVGFFGVVLLANSCNAVGRVQHLDGLAADRAYDRGIHYNEGGARGPRRSGRRSAGRPTMPSTTWASGGCGSR